MIKNRRKLFGFNNQSEYKVSNFRIICLPNYFLNNVTYFLIYVCIHVYMYMKMYVDANIYVYMSLCMCMYTYI